MLETRVDGLALDVTTNSPVVILSPLKLNKVLPIWIGHSEAWAIAMELSAIPAKRPMTHDLMKSVIESLGVNIERILIHNIENNTFYARITLSKDREEWEVDARPSDAIAIGLRSECPIYVSEKVIVEASITDKSKYEKEKIEFKKFFQDLKPADFNR